MVSCDYIYFDEIMTKSKLKNSKTSSQIENSYKKTVAFDPTKSETYRALHEDHFGQNVHEIPITVQHQTYQAPRQGAPVSSIPYSIFTLF